MKRTNATSKRFTILLTLTLCLLTFAQLGVAEPPKDAAAPAATEQAAPGAPEAPEAQDSAEHNWEITVAPYMWLSGLSMDVTKDDVDVSKDVAFADVFKVLKFANQVHLEAVRDEKWGVFTDATYIKLGDESSVRIKPEGFPFRVKADLEWQMEQVLIEAGGFRRFGNEDAAYDVLLGARYESLSSKVDLGPFDAEMKIDGVDPFVGARGIWRLSDKWGFTVRGDVGGFGALTDLTLNGSAIFSYKVRENTSIGIDYRYMEQRNEDDETELNLKTYGPLLGFIHRF